MEIHDPAAADLRIEAKIDLKNPLVAPKSGSFYCGFSSYHQVISRQCVEQRKPVWAS